MRSALRMRIVLFGYGEMGCAGLEFLLAQREDVAAVVTHRDDPHEKRWYRSLAEVAAAEGPRTAASTGASRRRGSTASSARSPIRFPAPSRSSTAEN